MDLHVARVHEQPAREHGQRWLVDRSWPRGVSRGAAALDRWCQQIAPSTPLRAWYGHDPERFAEFAERYAVELAQGEQAEAVAQLREALEAGPVTLLTATKDLELSHATVLRNQLLARA